MDQPEESLDCNPIEKLWGDLELAVSWINNLRRICVICDRLCQKNRQIYLPNAQNALWPACIWRLVVMIGIIEGTKNFDQGNGDSRHILCYPKTNEQFMLRITSKQKTVIATAPKLSSILQNVWVTAPGAAWKQCRHQGNIHTNATHGTYDTTHFQLYTNVSFKCTPQHIEQYGLSNPNNAQNILFYVR